MRLTEVNPAGRTDVLAYRVAEALGKRIAPGWWPEAQPLVERAIRENVPPRALGSLTPLDWLKQLVYATYGPIAGPVAVAQLPITAAYAAADAVDTKVANALYPPENYPPPPTPASPTAPQTVQQMTVYGQWTPTQAIDGAVIATQKRNKDFFNTLADELDSKNPFRLPSADLLWLAAGLGALGLVLVLRKR